MRLSEHFTLEEFTRSQTAARHGISNKPDNQVLINLVYMAQTMERVRALFDKPVHISSGYRSPKLNRKIGGSKTSDHMKGLAADFTVQGVLVQEAFSVIKSSLIPYDQIIEEFGDWIHLSIPEIGSDAQTKSLIAIRQDGQTHYRNAA